MTTQTEALKIARRVLSNTRECDAVNHAIECIDKALAQPEPPPECQTEAEKTAFAFGWFKALEQQRLAQPEQDIPKIGCVNHDCDKCKAQPEQEPVAFEAWYQNAIWGNEDFKAGCKRAWNAAIKTTTPPQRNPLPWERVLEIGIECANDRSRLPYEVKIARAVEAAHGIKE